MEVPSLYEWIGGAQMIEKVVAELYRRVPDDDLLAPIFATMGADHVAHRKRWMDLLFQCADDLGVKSDPEFRSSVLAGVGVKPKGPINRKLRCPIREA